ncbi:hypothetical protein CNR22_12090 [Sphingobacteriaceae bacterium]|nr:hypothetical protein CNR22_12090 [Sphingobacteriaceae bacterium]
MFPKRILVVILVLSFVKGLKAQSSIGFDVQINRDFFELKDEGSALKNGLGINVSPAFIYRYGFGSKLTFLTGMRLKLYSEEIAFKKLVGTFTSSGNASLVIPCHLEKNINLYHYKLFLSPLLGLNYNFLLNSGSTMEGAVSTPNDSARFKSTKPYERVSFFTAMAGLSLEYRFRPSTSIALYWQYTKGFSTVTSQNISYTVNDGAEMHAVQNNTGTYFTYLGVRIYRHFPRRIKTARDKKE